GAVHHATGNFAARMSLGVHPAQNPQDVILRARHTVFRAHPVRAIVERIGSDDHAQQSFLRGRGELLLLEAALQSLGHALFIDIFGSTVIPQSSRADHAVPGHAKKPPRRWTGRLTVLRRRRVNSELMLQSIGKMPSVIFKAPRRLAGTLTCLPLAAP